jgi:glutamate-1-semialdehyde 2,1-aminomutase
MTDHELLQRALAVTPMASQTRSKAPGKVGPRDSRSGFPLFAEGGEGPYLIANEGQRYLDFAGANAAIPLGYGRPEVAAAVADAACKGSLLSLPSVLEAEVSEQFCAAVGSESVRWVKTGSEAVSAAVRAARCATGASAVLVGVHSYHGWHDWTYARFDGGLPFGQHSYANGVPSALGSTIFLYDWEKAAHEKIGIAAAVARAHGAGKRVAAILVEPHRLMQDQKARMQVAREEADKAGAVLIFDEMVYGFRWATAGGQEYFGVRPDLSCFGKALGNGVPIACVTGSRHLVGKVVPAFVSGTYGGDRLGLAAAGAVLTIYEEQPIITTLWRNGQTFFDAFGETMEIITKAAATSLVGYGSYGPPTPKQYALSWLDGFPVHFTIKWRSPEQADDVLTRLAQRGYLFHRDANNASAVMTEAEVRGAAAALAEELKRV